jgi:HKD family nuclease
VVSSLEEEIREIESEITESQALLDDLKKQESETEKTRVDLQDLIVLANERKSLSSKAEPSQKSYLSLKGLHSWSAVSVCESRLSFNSIGQSSQTSNTLTYEISNPGVEAWVSSNKSALTASKQYPPKSSPSVASFLAACVEEQAKAIQKQSLTSACQIGENMQGYMWMTGRLDQTAIELQTLRRRYKTKFTQEGESFLFSVEFRSQSSAKIIVDFEIDHHYPSLPLKVRLDLMEGTMDLESIRRALQKNAKPGFGNLSRACGIVAAFVA